MELLKHHLEAVKIGPARTFAGLTVFPLIGGRGDRRRYLTLDEALADGTLHITERGAAGVVPELRLVNTGGDPVLLLDGEELAGAKQNRVLNVTILAPAGKEIVVPVTCVEQGRWARTSERFASRPHVMYAAGRGAKMQQVVCSVRTTGRYTSNQLHVWADVADTLRKHGVTSRSQRLDDVFQAKGHEVDEFVAAFRPLEGQVGAVFALAGRLEGVEMFDDARTLAQLWPKLVRSWALDAIGLGNRPHEVPAADTVRSWLLALVESSVTEHPGVGLGRDLRLSSAEIMGSALEHDGVIVHLCAFRRRDEREGGSGTPGYGRMAPPSQRGNHGGVA